MKTISLSKPIDDNGKTVTELTFREATTGDVMASDAVTGAFSKQIAVLAGMAGVSLSLMKKVALADLNHVVDEVADLLGESPAAAGANA